MKDEIYEEKNKYLLRALVVKSLVKLLWFFLKFYEFKDGKYDRVS